jgi:hypothetical protein
MICSSASRRVSKTPLALVEHGERIGQRLAAGIELLARGERRILVRGFIYQPVLPLAGIAVLADRGVDRVIGNAKNQKDHVQPWSSPYAVAGRQ